MPLMRCVAALLALTLCAAGCAGQSPSQTFDRGKIDVVTTISTLNSFVQGVGGDKVRVTSIVPVGASPETYEPTPQDVATVSKARILVENGAGLETWLDRLLRNASSPKLQTVVASDGLTVIDDNPHLWMDPQYAKHYVLQIRDGLIAVDPADANTFRINAMHYNAALDALTAHIRAQIQTIPPSQRYMIVFHNAWQYYNNRFGITTLGFVERNPGQEPNPQQVAQLVDLAKQHNVKGVFSEPEYSPKILYSIAQGAGIKVVENLYDDSIGTTPQVSNYLSMLNYDTNIIVNALK
jgi:manganese/iron transport system substrate-binding protein